MNRIFYGSLSLLAVFASACTALVEGNGVPAQQERRIAAFHDIEVSDTLHAQIIVGPEQSVIVHGDSNLIHHIRTDATGGYLFVDTDVSYATSLDLGVLITTPALYGVTARDVSTVEADGIWDTAFSIVADDASHVRVSGYAEDSSLWVSGASDVDASELATWTTWIEMDGASTASLDVRERLSGTISGASTAYVFGQPLIVDAVVYDAASVILQ